MLFAHIIVQKNMLVLCFASENGIYTEVGFPQTQTFMAFHKRGFNASVPSQRQKLGGPIQHVSTAPRYVPGQQYEPISDQRLTAENKTATHEAEQDQGTAEP